MKPYIVICEKFSIEAQVTLTSSLKSSNLAEVVKLSSLDELADHLPKATALIIRSKTKITRELIAAAPNLNLIITCTSGFDHIDLQATQEKNIHVMYTPTANAQSAAELAWGLILNTHRPILDSHKQIKAGLWDREKLSPGFELAGRTIGIVGLGRIGQKIATFAKAFSMNVVAFDPYQEDEVFEHFKLERSSYEELLKQSDIITFHVPLTKETKNMLNRSHYEYTTKDVVIINASRGSVVNEDDLCEALDEGEVRMAGLDVFAKEPLSRESKLLKSSKVILTQHIGAMTEQAFAKASMEAATLCIDFLKTNKTQNSLPFKNNWGSLMFND
ncbi:phosphoglycerate dehydrogenase [Bdellovibrio sp. qaytius]|nr:phosphoglycerate dehydrogenase [Bdellovibrio sp. qaytius]